MNPKTKEDFDLLYSHLESKLIEKCQRAKKVVSDSSGLVDFAFRLVIFVLNLPDGQVLFFWGGNSNYRRIVINPADQKGF